MPSHCSPSTTHHHYSLSLLAQTKSAKDLIQQVFGQIFAGYAPEGRRRFSDVFTHQFLARSCPYAGQSGSSTHQRVGHQLPLTFVGQDRLFQLQLVP